MDIIKKFFCLGLITLAAEVSLACGPTFDISVPPRCDQTIYGSLIYSGSQTPVSYLWDFGDGLTSALATPIHIYAVPGTYTVSLTIIWQNGCQSTATRTAIAGKIIPDFTVDHRAFVLGSPITVNYVGTDYGFNARYELDMGDGLGSFSGGNIFSSVGGNPFTGQSWTYTYNAPGTYFIKLYISKDEYCSEVYVLPVAVLDGNEVQCKECLPSFAPIPGEEYVLSAWVKEAAFEGLTQFDKPQVTVAFGNSSTTFSFAPTGPVVDGWQKIEEPFQVPFTAKSIKVKLENTGTGDIFFDDIRIMPVNAQFRSFVYDPQTLRLMAELDDNNYATFYEYDEEGALIRIKKETERGIKTIQEAGNNTSKPQ